MRVVFRVDKENKSAAEERISKDPVGRQSITVRDGASLDLEEGTYIRIDGTEEACEQAREWLEELGTELEGDDREEVVAKMDEQESSVAEGVGGLFGD